LGDLVHDREITQRRLERKDTVQVISRRDPDRKHLQKLSRINCLKSLFLIAGITMTQGFLIGSRHFLDLLVVKSPGKIFMMK